RIRSGCASAVARGVRRAWCPSARSTPASRTRTWASSARAIESQRNDDEDRMTPLPRWLEPFSPDFRKAIASQVKEPGRKLACFDADGTLWSEDIGEAFFRWLAAGELLPPLGKGRDPFEVYAEYEERVARSRADGFSWAVQCMAGLAETDVRR